MIDIARRTAYDMEVGPVAIFCHLEDQWNTAAGIEMPDVHAQFDALLAQRENGVPRQIVCLELDGKGIARQDARADPCCTLQNHPADRGWKM